MATRSVRVTWLKRQHGQDLSSIGATPTTPRSAVRLPKDLESVRSWWERRRANCASDGAWLSAQFFKDFLNATDGRKWLTPQFVNDLLRAKAPMVLLENASHVGSQQIAGRAIGGSLSGKALENRGADFLRGLHNSRSGICR
jgi:hypothetical protein